jgi:8-oxo-dGTP diphosphatase
LSVVSREPTSQRENVIIAVGEMRQDDRVLMVHQAGPGEEPLWSTPGGRIESGELITEGLVREIREETGVRVLAPGQLALSMQVDNRQDGWYATVWTFEISEWEGEINVDDPDGFVSEAPGSSSKKRSRGWS